MKIGILNGVHEDIESLKKAFTVFQEHECEKIVCLGDIVGYSVPYYGYFHSRNAEECVALVKKHCTHIVLGNHDLFTIKQLPNISPFDYPKNWYDLTFLERKELAKGEVWTYEDELPALLKKSDIEYLATLPEYLILDVDNIKILLTHYISSNMTGDLTQTEATSDNLEQHFEFMEKNGCQISLFAHDLQNGLKVFTKNNITELGFTTLDITNLPLAISGPWVANGTEKNGVLILDSKTLTVETIPLNTEPHRVPKAYN